MMWMWCSSIQVVIGLIFSSVSPSEAVVPCNVTHNLCEELLWNSSQCRDGFCTNPFQGGCLRSLLASKDYAEKYGNEDGGDESNSPSPSLAALRRRLLAAPRVCNSEDGSAEVERGICVENVNEYPEVRLYSQNWESAFVLSWIMQIIYSELLGVPSTIETGMVGKNLNFYDETNRMDYGSGNSIAELENAHDAGGVCSSYNQKNAAADNDEDYVPCAHAIMEVWQLGAPIEAAKKNGVIKSLQPNGVAGYQGWYINKLSIERDPSLASSSGLSGEINRKKMADTFKRPTTWSDYCNFVSSTNCTVEDDVANRPPTRDGSEEGRYFALGHYTGHFRFTDKNNCTMNENCTGHFTDYPCGWTSFVKQQTYHLKIALESDGNEDSGGYSYTEMIDIWSAANATKSAVIGLWFKPDATAALFEGSGSDFMRVMLPNTNQECLDNRIETSKTCDPTATKFDLYGDEKGACGEHYSSLSKIAMDMQLVIKANENKKAQMSPAYDVFRDFSISQFQVDEILSTWIFRGKDKFNFDLRYATCEWMADNLEHIVQTFIPPSHPRALVASKSPAVGVVAFILGAVAIVLTAGTSMGVLRQYREGTLMKGSQISFLVFLLAGLLLVSIGSILLALEPSKGTCVGSVWLINVGYSLQLVPMIIRVSTIINVVQASRKMKIVKVNMQKLLVRSIGITAIMALYCMFWTIFDPPQSQASIQVTNDKNEFGETVLLVSNHCDSKSNLWYLVSFISQAMLLLCGSVLARQMRSVPDTVNDSRQLAFMIYTSFLFLLLRTGLYLLQGNIGVGISQKVMSMCCSIDVVANVLLFFRRFFFKVARRDEKEKPNVGSEAYYANKISQRESSKRSTGSLSKKSIGSEVFAEEEKQEDDGDEISTLIRFRAKDRSVDLPKWVWDKYGVEVKQ